MNKSIKIFAPATISNVGSGFDTIGFAISKPGDIVKIKLRNDNKILIKSITGDKGILSKDINKNTCTYAIKAMLKSYNKQIGVDVYISKKMPIGSGLGSSAASAVAGVFGLNILLGKPYSMMQVMDFALEGESIASGVIHADNVAPSLFGGFILIRDYNPIDIIKLPVPKSLYCSVVYPHISIETKEARKLIKKNIPLNKARTHFGNIGALINALHTDDYSLLSRSIHDEISEPARAQLIPGFHNVKQAALENGALGCSLSGSGPSIFAFAKGKSKAEYIAKVMKSKILIEGIKATTYVSKINPVGPKIL